MMTRVRPSIRSFIPTARPLCKPIPAWSPPWRTSRSLPSFSRPIHNDSGCQMQALLERLGITDVLNNFGIEALTQRDGLRPWDYQALDTVGDAFLKLATSVHIYLDHPHKNEGEMSALRDKEVHNAGLRQKASHANLATYILGQRPDMARNPVTQTDSEPGDRRYRCKPVLADVLEALLGAGFLSGGVQLGLKIGTALGLCIGGTIEWSQRRVTRSFAKHNGQKKMGDALGPVHEDLQRKIGYEFKEPRWLLKALTHHTATSARTGCYEREEWLGDAVLDMWIIEHVYRRFSGATRGQLSLVRALMVSNPSLGFLAIRKLGLHKLVIHASEPFPDACAEAVEAIEPYPSIANFYQDVSNLFVVFDPPKILNDVLEAVLGAVFVDSGFNLEAVYRTLDLIFEDVMPGLTALDPRSPTARLWRQCVEHECEELDYWVYEMEDCIDNEDDAGAEFQAYQVCEIMFHDETIAIGRHSTSMNVAEQRAALEALRVLNHGKDTGQGQGGEKSAGLWSMCNCKELKAEDEAMFAAIDAEEAPMWAAIKADEAERKLAAKVKDGQLPATPIAKLVLASPSEAKVDDEKKTESDSVQIITLEMEARQSTRKNIEIDNSESHNHEASLS